MPTDNTPQDENFSMFDQLKQQVQELSNYVDQLWYVFSKKTGSGSNEIYGSKMSSVNFRSGSAGWQLTPDGNLEANNGNFRGDITGASGTFSGTVNVGSLNIPDSVTANSMHVDSNGNTWWGANVATGYTGASAYILKDGTAVFGTVAAGNISFDGSKLVVSDSNVMNSFVAYENITAGQAVAIGDGVAYLVTANSTDLTGYPITTTDWLSQKFSTDTLGIAVPNVDFTVRSTSTNSYGFRVSIRADSGGAPTGADLVSKDVTVSCTNGVNATVFITFDTALTISPNTNYHILIRRTDATSGTINVRGGTTAATGTNASSNSGSTWGANNGALMSELYEAEGILGQVGRASASTGRSRTTNFIGFAYETKTTGQTIRIITLGLAATLASISTGTFYYLSDTVGAISSSAGSFTRKVGFAVSTTKIMITNIW